MARKKPQLIQIENSTELHRDVNSKAIISADKNAYRCHLDRKRREKEKEDQISDLKARLQKLEDIVTALVSAK